MFGMFKKDPAKKLRQQMEKKLEEARDQQRNGDIVQYAQLMAEAEEIGQKLDSLTS